MESGKRCLNCDASGLEVFYEQDGVPIHSCVLVDRREEAIDFPRGDLRLALCPSCGFIGNLAFEPERMGYSDQYEETQTFSPRFNEFQRRLVERLVDRHALRGKDVLEIGCGKGEFLVELCELGTNRGIGLDPGYHEERTRSEAASRIRFIKELYGENHAHLNADFVCCRHTLEHIAPTADFLRTIRRAFDRGTVVFFEVPDTGRVLREEAFWDLYYEHCSYFTKGSLSRLFRSQDYEILDLWLDFDDQYVLLEARAAAGPGPTHAAEEAVEVTVAEVERFRTRVPSTVRHWRDRLRRLRDEGRPAAVWCSGSKAVAFLNTMQAGEEVRCVVDINPHKHGKFLAGTGHRIDGPEALLKVRPEVVILMNPVYEDEVRADLGRMGLRPELLSLGNGQ